MSTSSNKSEFILQQLDTSNLDIEIISSSNMKSNMLILKCIKALNKIKLVIQSNNNNSSKASNSSSKGILSDNEFGMNKANNINISDTSDDNIDSNLDITCNINFDKNRSRYY